MKAFIQKILTIVALFCCAQTISADPIVITGTNVRLRMAPSTNANTLVYTSTGLNVHVNKGDRFDCYGHSNGFCNIVYDGYSVWGSSQYTYHLEVTLPTWVTVTGDGVRLRKGASLKSAVYTQVNRGTQLRCIGQTYDFWQVNYRGNYLWVSKQYAY